MDSHPRRYAEGIAIFLYLLGAATVGIAIVATIAFWDPSDPVVEGVFVESTMPFYSGVIDVFVILGYPFAVLIAVENILTEQTDFAEVGFASGFIFFGGFLWQFSSSLSIAGYLTLAVVFIAVGIGLPLTHYWQEM